jgi:hypothetical protein
MTAAGLAVFDDGDGGLGAEKRYLLCLLNVAEELLALMPPLVQRKYGLIKGTLAVKLGSDGELKPDSAILASLASGIQPQVASCSTTPHGRAPPDARAHDGAPLYTPPAGQVPGGGLGGKAAVVRSLHSQLAPERDCDREHMRSVSQQVQDEGTGVGARGSSDLPGGQAGPDAVSAQERKLEKTMMRHHFRALQACICSVRAATGDADTSASGNSSRVASDPQLGHGSAAPGPQDATAEPEQAAGRDTEPEARAQDASAVSSTRNCPPHLAAAATAPLVDDNTASVTEMLMSCSEALGTLQVASLSHVATERCLLARE